ncbi:MAG TPA: methyltransferase domain-containing protein [Ktedonobacteraceae bacterium]|nr:methyltransferase domain-containing protein [Ktedonobacteraceae bacterium]
MLFENPFHMEDVLVFDDAALRSLLCHEGFGLSVEDLAHSLHGMSEQMTQRIERNISARNRAAFHDELRRDIPPERVDAARRTVLDQLFWELTYWETPDLYEELTEGEWLHPGIFQQLAPDIRGNVVLDAGAGSGRASLECVKHGAAKVYAVEPSPGLLRILRKKLGASHDRIVHRQGRFDAIPLPDKSVDLTISCSAFTADPAQGGETGLAELQRVTRNGGKVVIIWPRVQDYDWLARHGFNYVALQEEQEMCVHFRSLDSALRCARHFYAHNPEVERFIERERRSDVPFSVLGINPPRDYCWLVVK